MSAAVSSFNDYNPSGFYQSTGVSAEGISLAGIARKFQKYMASANVGYGHLNEILTAVEEAAGAAVEADWDGEGALPVDQHTVALATRFVSALPSDIKVPDVYAQTRGELTFEWRSGKGRIVSVSVYPNGTIGYASLIGSSKSYGNESFIAAVPAALVRRIAKVYS